MAPTTLPSRVHVCCGSYDRAVCGFDLVLRPEDSAEDRQAAIPFTRRYATAAHSGPVRCVASRGNVLASAGDDEIIRLYDVAKMVEIGSLMEQSASITHLQMGNGIMLSGAEDGTICVWSVKSWDCLSKISAHKGRITGLALHPTSPVALSVGADRSLCIWDLATFKKVFSIKAKTGTHSLQWSPSGEHYAFLCDKECRVSDRNGNLLWSLAHDSRVLSFAFIAETYVATGTDDGTIRVWSCTAGEDVAVLQGHDKRVSALASVQHGLLASASSDGRILLWDLQCPDVPLGAFEANLRITSLCSVRTDTPSIATDAASPAPAGTPVTKGKKTKSAASRRQKLRGVRKTISK
ncbi:WD domain, G-beta repeat [Plasmodiophora brassicae]